VGNNGTKSREGQVIAASKGNHGGRPKVIDDDMLTFAVALKDKGVPVPDIAKKLTIKTGKNAGKSPSVASLYRALADAETAADDGLPMRPKPVRIRRPEGPLTPKQTDLRERLQSQPHPNAEIRGRRRRLRHQGPGGGEVAGRFPVDRGRQGLTRSGMTDGYGNPTRSGPGRGRLPRLPTAGPRVGPLRGPRAAAPRHHGAPGRRL
jgi:hypothetical protein